MVKNSKVTSVDWKQMFAEYAKKELDFIEKSDPEKVYHRVFPNFTNKDQGTIEFIYKKITIGGFIDKDTIYLNKLKISKWGKESDVESVVNKITEIINKGDMKIVNQL